MDLSPTEIDERNAVRDYNVVSAAARIIERVGLSGLTRDAIAAEANISAASVSNFGRYRISNGDHSDEGYRSRIMRGLMERALSEGDVKLLRVGLADGCLKLADVPARLRSAVGG